jgi:hypothetical protein
MRAFINESIERPTGRSSKILQWFFWVAFAIFLAASIPHVAYFFRASEPSMTGSNTWGWWYWLIAYAIAISIDVTIFLLSLSVCELARKRADRWLLVSVWLFIILLSALSWLMNWEYAVQFHSSVMLVRPEGQVVLTRVINPMIASCFQLLSIAYTWMSDKLLHFSGQPLSSVPVHVQGEDKPVPQEGGCPPVLPQLLEEDTHVATTRRTVPAPAYSSLSGNGRTRRLSSSMSGEAFIPTAALGEDTPPPEVTSDAGGEGSLLARTVSIVRTHPDITVRDLAVLLGKSKTVASKWKKRAMEDMFLSSPDLHLTPETSHHGRSSRSGVREEAEHTRETRSA